MFLWVFSSSFSAFLYFILCKATRTTVQTTRGSTVTRQCVQKQPKIRDFKIKIQSYMQLTHCRLHVLRALEEKKHKNISYSITLLLFYSVFSFIFIFRPCSFAVLKRERERVTNFFRLHNFVFYFIISSFFILVQGPHAGSTLATLVDPSEDTRSCDEERTKQEKKTHIHTKIQRIHIVQVQLKYYPENIFFFPLHACIMVTGKGTSRDNLEHAWLLDRRVTLDHHKKIT